MTGVSFRDLVRNFVITKRFATNARLNYIRYSEIFGNLKFVVLKVFYIESIGILAGILKKFVNLKISLI